MKHFAIFMLAGVNTVMFFAMMVLMFETGGYLEAHEGKPAGGSLMMIILWALANAAATWRLASLEEE